MIIKYPYDEGPWLFNSPVEYCKYAWEQRRENQRSLLKSFKGYFLKINIRRLKKSNLTMINIRILGFDKTIYIWNCNERTAKKYDNLFAERLLNAIEYTRETIEKNSL